MEYMRAKYSGNSPIMDVVLTSERPDPKEQIEQFLGMATYRAENARGFPTAPESELRLVQRLVDFVDDKDFREKAIDKSDAIRRQSYESAIDYCVREAARKFAIATKLDEVHSANNRLNEAQRYTRILEYERMPDRMAKLEETIEKDINRRTPLFQKLLNRFGASVLIPLFGNGKSLQAPVTEEGPDESDNFYVESMSDYLSQWQTRS